MMGRADVNGRDRQGVRRPRRVGRGGVRFTALLALFAALFALSGVASAADSGSVTATVTITAPEACIVVHATEVDFEELAFGASKTSHYYDVESCSEAQQDLYAATSVASNADETVTWTPVADSTTGVGEFAVNAGRIVGNKPWLQEEPVLVDGWVPGQRAPVVHQFNAPQRGTAGAGQLMSFQLTWTGVLVD
jgi:hypothetical protein